MRQSDKFLLVEGLIMSVVLGLMLGCVKLIQSAPAPLPRRGEPASSSPRGNWILTMPDGESRRANIGHGSWNMALPEGGWHTGDWFVTDDGELRLTYIVVITDQNGVKSECPVEIHLRFNARRGCYAGNGYLMWRAK